MKKTNKKLLLALGTLTTVAAPVAAVVSCGAGQEVKQHKLLPTYTGQEDQLLSLGIKSDYYPYQLDKTDLFNYIKTPKKYISTAHTDGFADKFANKLASLIPSERGTSWWNQQALDDGEHGSNPEYWQHMSGDVVMYEHYLLDDGAKKVDASTAPKHFDNPRTYIQTNFRASRDPFTRLPKQIMYALLDNTDQVSLLGYDSLKANTDADSKAQIVIIDKMLKIARAIEGESKTEKAVDGKPAPTGVAKRDATDDESWLYNDYFFATQYHENFMDNPDFAKKPMEDWIQNLDGGNAQKIFDADDTKDKDLANLFFTATYTPQERELLKVAYKDYTGVDYKEGDTKLPAAAHHPIYEQQESFGGAPMFEGAQRDNMLYFYDTSNKLTQAFTEPATSASAEDKAAYAKLVETFGKTSSTFTHALNARANANKISANMRTRMAAIKEMVVAAGNPTFGLMTLAPGGGVTTMQTMSKYSFLYNELGFTQPTPSNLHQLASDPVKNVPGDKGSKDSFFNMDDNGWWWNLGAKSSEIIGRSEKFANTLDLGLFAANDTQYNNDVSVDEKASFLKMFRTNKPSDLSDIKVDYNLWNEGLKTPFVMNMMLDKIYDMLVAKYGSGLAATSGNTAAKGTQSAVEAATKDAALSWGEYWTKDYLK